SVFTRLVMLQTFAANRIADGKEKIVVIVVTRLEELLRFDHQVLMELQFLRSDFEIGGPVGENVEVDRIICPAGKVDALEVSAGIGRRVDQRIQSGFLEMNQVAVLRFHIQRAGEFPCFGHTQSGLELDVAGEISCRIKEHAVPGHVGELRGDAASSRAFASCGALTWKACMSTLSRTQGTRLPFAVMTRPASSSTGFEGECVPGSHS